MNAYQKVNHQLFLEKIINCINDYIFVMEVGEGPTFTFITVNERAKIALGVNDEVLGKKIEEVVSNEKAEFLTNIYKEVLTKNDKVIFEFSDKEGRFEETSLNPYLNENGDITHIVAVVRDISERKRIERAYGIVKDHTVEQEIFENVKSNELYYRTLIDRSPDPTVIHQDGYIRYVNYAYATLLESSSREKLIGKAIEDFSPISQREYLREKIQYFYEEQDSMSMEDKIITLTGKTREVEVFATKTTYKNKEAVYAVLRDVTDRKKIERKIENMAFYDYLTELPNRQLFKELLEKAIEDAKRYKKNFALLYIDGDKFKDVNDTIGHQGGDEFIKAFAKRIQDSVRKVDTVARVGGDEFNVLLMNIQNNKEILHVIKRIYQNLEKEWSYDEQVLPMLMSVGVAVYPEDGEDFKTLVKNADEALYAAKENGGNIYQFFHEIK
ncbi:diguanylate cyclase domain-containing protein [Anaerobacillus sp. MEB173]|uniref:PAS domain-containing protein n=1 Tax=Anaerobacillus sp. MEB173 TaxID=3383345 RepID=UPI003F9302A9